MSDGNKAIPSDIRRQFRIPLRRRLYWRLLVAWRFVFGHVDDISDVIAETDALREVGYVGLWWVHAPGEWDAASVDLMADGEIRCGCGQPQPCKHVRFLRRKGATI